MPIQVTIDVDDLDYAAICRATARRQTFRCMPDGDGNMIGRLLAEICRGWEEMLDCRDGGVSGEEWKRK